MLVTLVFITGVVAYLGGEYLRKKETPKKLAHYEHMVQGQLAVMAATTIDAVKAEDLAILETVVLGLSSVAKDIYRVEIVDTDNRTIFDWRRPDLMPETKESHLIFFSQPVMSQGEKIGVIIE